MTAAEVRQRSALSDSRERDGLAALALTWWEQRCVAPGILPAAIDALPTIAQFASESAYLLSAAFLNPMKPTFRLLGFHGSDASREAKAVGESGAALRTCWRALYDDLSFVAVSGTPSYHCIHRIDGTDRVSYRRLILPLSADGRVVSQLVVMSSTGSIA